MPPPGSYLRQGRYVALAFDFSGTIAAGAIAGWLIDRELGTDPYGVAGLTIIAVVGGFVRLVLELRRLDRLDHAK